MRARRDKPWANHRLIIWATYRRAYGRTIAWSLSTCKKTKQAKKKKTSFFNQNLHQYGVGLPNRVPTPLRRSKNETGALPELTSLSYLVKFQATT